MGETRRARILGTGSAVPDRVVSNDELSRLIDTSDEWIVERTGIRERRWVPEGSGIGSAALGAQAARRALESAGVAPEQIGLIVFATLSPDHDFPGNGVLLQRELGIRAPATLDIRQQCNGFLYGLSIADAYIRAGLHDHVLVVAAEVQSTGLDLSDRGRDMTVIFADGAGAAVVGPASDERSLILSTHLHVDGAHAQHLWCEFPSSRAMPRLTPSALAEGRHYPRMNGRVVFKHAVLRMEQAVREACTANGISVEALDLLVPHQANLRIVESVRSSLALPPEKVAVNVDRYGNTTSASIPLALDESLRSGRVRAGDCVCLAAFGSGFTWGSALLRL
jgi:3-oxoacyl-[acyl-carrier-protein] synthase-3